MLDYGYGEAAGFCETLQAVSGHKFAEALAEPGENDISAHVDFAALAQAGRRGGAAVFGPATQGMFLANLGITERAEQLIKANPDRRPRPACSHRTTDRQRPDGPAVQGAGLRAAIDQRHGGLCAMSSRPQPAASGNLKAPGIAHGFFGRDGGVSTGIYASLNCGPGSRDAPRRGGRESPPGRRGAGARCQAGQPVADPQRPCPLPLERRGRLRAKARQN